jgi:hypothetical protein
VSGGGGREGVGRGIERVGHWQERSRERKREGESGGLRERGGEREEEEGREIVR